MKKCPFCGSDDLIIREYPEQENEVLTYFSKRYSVLCIYTGDEKGCGAESGHYKSEDEAIENWERRDDK